MKYLFIILMLISFGLNAQSDSTIIKSQEYQIEYLQKVIYSLKQELSQYEPFTNPLRVGSVVTKEPVNRYNQSVMFDIGHIGNLFYVNRNSEDAFNQFRVGIGYSRRLSKDKLFWYIRASTDLGFEYHSFTWGYEIMLR